MELKHIPGIMQDLEKLMQAKALLDEIYNVCGGYGNRSYDPDENYVNKGGAVANHLPMELKEKLNQLYGFDDSE